MASRVPPRRREIQDGGTLPRRVEKTSVRQTQNQWILTSLKVAGVLVLLGMSFYGMHSMLGSAATFGIWGAGLPLLGLATLKSRNICKKIEKKEQISNSEKLTLIITGVGYLIAFGFAGYGAYHLATQATVVGDLFSPLLIGSMGFGFISAQKDLMEKLIKNKKTEDDREASYRIAAAEEEEEEVVVVVTPIRAEFDRRAEVAPIRTEVAERGRTVKAEKASPLRAALTRHPSSLQSYARAALSRVSVTFPSYSQTAKDEAELLRSNKELKKRLKELTADKDLQEYLTGSDAKEEKTVTLYGNLKVTISVEELKLLDLVRFTDPVTNKHMNAIAYIMTKKARIESLEREIRDDEEIDLKTKAVCKKQQEITSQDHKATMNEIFEYIKLLEELEKLYVQKIGSSEEVARREADERRVAEAVAEEEDDEFFDADDKPDWALQVGKP